MLHIKFVLFFVAILKSGNFCGSFSGGGILNSPTLSMNFNPPVGWTYPPNDAQTSLSYLPGQSLTLSEAQNLANGAITAAVLEALNSANIPTTGVNVTPSYTPPMVNDCYKAATPAFGANTPFYIVENGAVTKIATVGAPIQNTNCLSHNYQGGSTTTTITYQEFIQQATVSIKNLVISQYQMDQIAANIMSLLTLNSGAQFTQPITVN
uniref:Uncharacterized protein n=1 Tax=Panagrolaimus sp. JU765 TaxID=591449 RepID=A0AC34QEA8_9BILA